MNWQASLSIDQRRLYGDLAWTWPIISPPEHYVEEAEQFLKVIQEHARIEAKTLLDLGCGGGHNDFTLKKHFDVTGIDVSPEMLALARRLNPDVTYALGDMRTVRLDKTFDAVLIADSINYMLTVEDLRAAFVTAFVHLKPGGVFCTFAEETVERFEQNSIRYSTETRGDVEITLVENRYDPDSTDTTFELTLVYFIRHAGQLQVETDRHLSGLFALDTWHGLLEEVGFQVKQMEFAGEEIPMFVCIKPLS